MFSFLVLTVPVPVPVREPAPAHCTPVAIFSFVVSVCRRKTGPNHFLFHADLMLPLIRTLFRFYDPMIPKYLEQMKQVKHTDRLGTALSIGVEPARDRGEEHSSPPDVARQL